MVDTLQHACNRKFDTDPSLFRNDINNVAALQSARLQKKLMEETARLQQDQLEKATQSLRTEIVNNGKIQLERDELLKEIETLRRKKADELVNWDKERQDLKGQLSSMSSINGQQLAEVERLKQTVSELEKKIPNSRQDNCLPFQYNKSTVMIVNIRSQMALDAGKGETSSSTPELLVMMTDSSQMVATGYMVGNFYMNGHTRSSRLIRSAMIRVMMLTGLFLARTMAVSEAWPRS